MTKCMRDIPPELEAEAREGLRANARKSEGIAAFGHMSDEWVANEVRMLTRHDLWHEPICCAARDRIMNLSLEAERLRNQLAEFRHNQRRRDMSAQMAMLDVSVSYRMNDIEYPLSVTNVFSRADGILAVTVAPLLIMECKNEPSKR